ncbi:MAG: hypothetical protein KAR07_08115 [Spirochaetes bacterium]|nr:hypothetical protein [Spirochaetota bacterium]MCK5268117.1 hypothetical protein [Spirochaetota bacterium]
MRIQDFIEEAKKIKLHLLIITGAGLIIIFIMMLSSGKKYKIKKNKIQVTVKKIKRIVTDNNLGLLYEKAQKFMVLERFFMKKSGKNSYNILKKSYVLKESDLKKTINTTGHKKNIHRSGNIDNSSFRMETQSIFKPKKKRSYNKKSYD